MLEQSLNGARGVWQFREAGQGEWMPAEAPGCNYGDLLALGKIPDPFIGQNEEKSKWVAERDWEYRRAFFVDQALLQMDEVFLHCEMLDTLCEVFVNGILAGRGKNMHLRYDFSVKQYLREGENEVRIVFFSPLQFLGGGEARARARLPAERAGCAPHPQGTLPFWVGLGSDDPDQRNNA